MEIIRQNMPDETLCKYCKHALDVSQSECNEAAMRRSKLNGYRVVIECSAFLNKENEAGK